MSPVCPSPCVGLKGAPEIGVCFFDRLLAGNLLYPSAYMGHFHDLGPRHAKQSIHEKDTVFMKEPANGQGARAIGDSQTACDVERDLECWGLQHFWKSWYFCQGGSVEKC